MLVVVVSSSWHYLKTYCIYFGGSTSIYHSLIIAQGAERETAECEAVWVGASVRVHDLTTRLCVLVCGALWCVCASVRVHDLTSLLCVSVCGALALEETDVPVLPLLRAHARALLLVLCSHLHALTALHLLTPSSSSSVWLSSPALHATTPLQQNRLSWMAASDWTVGMHGWVGVGGRVWMWVGVVKKLF